MEATLYVNRSRQIRNCARCRGLNERGDKRCSVACPRKQGLCAQKRSQLTDLGQRVWAVRCVIGLNYSDRARILSSRAAMFSRKGSEQGFASSSILRSHHIDPLHHHARGAGSAKMDIREATVGFRKLLNGKGTAN